MPSREADFATRMAADATLMAILTGGVYKAETVGVEGITRESAAAAFDASGYLRPCALVRQRGLIPDGNVIDPMAQVTSATRVVEVWLYQDRNYDQIDLALARIRALFQGYQFSDSFEVFWINTIDRQRDTGALANASLARIDFAVYSVEDD